MMLQQVYPSLQVSMDSEKGNEQGNHVMIYSHVAICVYAVYTYTYRYYYRSGQQFTARQL